MRIPASRRMLLSLFVVSAVLCFGWLLLRASPSALWGRTSSSTCYARPDPGLPWKQSLLGRASANSSVGAVLRPRDRGGGGSRTDIEPRSRPPRARGLLDHVRHPGRRRDGHGRRCRGHPGAPVLVEHPVRLHGSLVASRDARPRSDDALIRRSVRSAAGTARAPTG